MFSYLARRAATHPLQNRLNLFFRRRAGRYYCIGETAQILTDRIFPPPGVKQRRNGNSQQYVGEPPTGAKQGMFVLRHAHLGAADYPTRLDVPTTWPYSRSIALAGSSQPSRDTASRHPSTSLACKPGSFKMRSIAPEIAPTSCATTSAALPSSSGAIPHSFVTTTGVPAAAASAAVFPKFS